MSDIFVSYASEDRARAKVLAGALERQGWSVWWDRRIPPGKQFSQVIKEAIDEAKCIIVLWSKESVKSDWVQNEAAEGARREILVPALIDDVEIPFEFRRIQAARLVDWEGRSPHPEFDTFLEAVRAILCQPLLPKASELTPDEQQPGLETEKAGSKSQKTKVLAAICIVALIAIVSIGVFLKYRQPKVVTNSIGMKLVYIHAGSFKMGSNSSAKLLASEYKNRGYDVNESHFEDQFPQHQVHISEDFWMGQTEVTQGQYLKVMNDKPWSGQVSVQEDDNNPAVYVTWDKVVEFCKKLSQQEGKTYRLPTEAEWEYACRASTTTHFSSGDSVSSLGDYAWFFDNKYEPGEGCARSVGQKKSNPWGLYDMHGNVWEWCSDWYDPNYYSERPSVDPQGPDSGEYHVARGGAWGAYEYVLRCSARLGVIPGYHSLYGFGFRVVRSQ